MSPERWQQVEEVLQAALDRPPLERAAFLDEACAGDGVLRSEAEQLLSAHEEAGEFLLLPAIARDAGVLFGDAQEDAYVGRVVGPYRIVGRLGAGGMGEVYLAQDARLGRAVALKILHDYFARDDARLRRFQREARAASALNHPNILTIHEVGTDDGVHFISTEFIDGRTLRELIASDALSLEEILDISVQLASALSAAHAAGIIHRDIKPENVMRRDDQLVKILDFGIAKLTEPPPTEDPSEAPTRILGQTEAGMVMGTVGYMSPEQARGLRVDERTDIWSLGCVLYEMLAGRAPFTGETRMDTLVAVLEREPAPLLDSAADAPTELLELQRIVTKALSKDRTKRYATAAEMLEDLRGVSRSVSGNLKGRAALEALRAARSALAGESESSTVSPALSSSTSRAMTAALAEQQARESRRRVVKALIAVSLLFSLAVVTFLYNRSIARRATAPATAKLYTEMTEAEQLAFIDNQEQNISAQMGEHPARLDEDALKAIKWHVDKYVARLGSTSTVHGNDDLRAVYARAVPYLPLIGRAFSERKVPVLVGIYLPLIESEYEPCLENDIGAKGLYQFLSRTAQNYGVSREEMCDAEKMTPAAAHYIADRMAELGDDAESMTLVIMSFNSGAERLRESLRRLREAGDPERNFWTLLANRDRLDDTFRNENAYYVPRFFAAAIIGENPHTFSLQTPPLTTLAGTNTPAKP